MTRPSPRVNAYRVGMSRPVLLRLHVAEAEREPLRLAIRRALRRGTVEYDPTRLVLVYAGLVADPTRLVPLTAPGLHALLDMLRWTNSERERTRWTKADLAALKAVRTRAELGEAAPAAEPEPTTLW